jgi:hypothetical protein
VCLQSLTVALRTAHWQEWFTNPTAGPWKKIRIYGVGDDERIRYLKEEDRPDLISANAREKIVIVIEAKDNISKLFDGVQLDKSFNVFEDNFDRLDGILSHHAMRLFNQSKVSLLCGYLYPISMKSTDSSEKLTALHRKHSSEFTDERLRPHLLFQVKQDDKQDLKLEYQLSDAPQSLAIRLAAALPETISLVGEQAALS